MSSLMSQLPLLAVATRCTYSSAEVPQLRAHTFGCLPCPSAVQPSSSRPTHGFLFGGRTSGGTGCGARALGQGCIRRCLLLPTAQRGGMAEMAPGCQSAPHLSRPLSRTARPATTGLPSFASFQGGVTAVCCAPYPSSSRAVAQTQGRPLSRNMKIAAEAANAAAAASGAAGCAAGTGAVGSTMEAASTQVTAPPPPPLALLRHLMARALVWLGLCKLLDSVANSFCGSTSHRGCQQRQQQHPQQQRWQPRQPQEQPHEHVHPFPLPQLCNQQQEKKLASPVNTQRFSASLFSWLPLFRPIATATSSLLVLSFFLIRPSTSLASAPTPPAPATSTTATTSRSTRLRHRPNSTPDIPSAATSSAQSTSTSATTTSTSSSSSSISAKSTTSTTVGRGVDEAFSTDTKKAGRARRYRATLVFSHACGLATGTPVRVRGSTVGTVVAVNPSLDSVDTVVEFFDAAATPIPRSSHIVVNQSGLVAETLVDITPPRPMPEFTAGPREIEACRREGVILCDGDRVVADCGVSVDELVGLWVRLSRKSVAEKARRDAAREARMREREKQPDLDQESQGEDDEEQEVGEVVAEEEGRRLHARRRLRHHRERRQGQVEN